MGFKERITDEIPMVPDYSQCTDSCVHYGGLVWVGDELVPVCPAYPKEIPAEFISGERWHTSIEKNQVGEFVFLAKPV